MQVYKVVLYGPPLEGEDYFASEAGLSECPNDISGCIKFLNLCFKTLSSGKPPSVYRSASVTFATRFEEQAQGRINSLYDPKLALDPVLGHGLTILGTVRPPREC